jgi:Macrocin-O-methyltransferase (TylF)
VSNLSIDDKSMRAEYFDLLKTTLTDFNRAEYQYAGAMPLEWVTPKSRTQAFVFGTLMRLFEPTRLRLVRHKRQTAAERLERRRNGHDWPPYAETMTGLRRLDVLQNVVETIFADNIPGDFIETGVWRGGSAIFMKAMLDSYAQTDRRLWLCDSFDGLPPPDVERFPADVGDTHHEYRFLAVALEDVKRNFEKYGLLDEKIEFVKGYFEDTLAHVPVERLALARLDGDMYGSTIVALEALCPKVVSGGFVLIDDYALPGCQRAVHEYRDAKGIDAKIVEIEDGIGAYWRMP